MLSFLKEALQIDKITAVITCLVVLSSVVYLMQQNVAYSNTRVVLVIGLFVAFLLLWLWVTSSQSDAYPPLVSCVLLVLQYICAVAIFFVVPYHFVAILLIIWVCQLPYFMPFKWALFTSPLWAAPIYLVFSFYWQHEMLISALLYWMFSLFALVMINSVRSEEVAKEALADKNRELLATQQLLTQATRQAERVRIARNIHDLLGHHLTALTINLQVAGHLTEGEAKQKVNECHGLAKLLLSDVREAVSEIREHAGLEVKAALQALIDNVPRLKVELEYDDQLVIQDMQVAETLIRCVQESITNSLKHSLADRLNICISQQQDTLQLRVADNGGKPLSWSLGNGLTGIRERVTALGGKADFCAASRGFLTTLTIPVAV